MSYPSSYTYETIYVVKSSLSDSSAGTIHQKVDQVIQKFDGKVKTREDWGLKEMAYPIDKQTHGKYAVVVYTGKQGVVDEIERHFKISDDVIRFLTVSVPADYDYGKYKKQSLMFEEEARKAREYKEQKKRERQQQ